MPQEQEGSIRRRRQLDRSAGDTDDRGWTPLHICARKGDLKENFHLISIADNASPTGLRVLSQFLDSTGGSTEKPPNFTAVMSPKPVNFGAEMDGLLPSIELTENTGLVILRKLPKLSKKQANTIISPNLLKQVKRLLKEGMDANVAAWGPKSHGVTPLHLAAKGGHLKVMDELLDRGADIDARTKGACGWTPLHNAAKERKKNAIRFLVENGAFLPDNINDTRFNPPLHYCPGLEWAYEEMKRLQQDNSSSSEITSSSSES